jgi:hypothetical protein
MDYSPGVLDKVDKVDWKGIEYMGLLQRGLYEILHEMRT